MPYIPVKQKIILSLFGIFLFIILLETGLRLGGYTISFWRKINEKNYFNRRSEYRIICLGESTTARGGQFSWPAQLEKLLNAKNIGLRFTVINEGIEGTNSAVMLFKLNSFLDKYNPDMVITMMGFNDLMYNAIQYENSPSVKIKLFLREFRIYKLSRILYLRILNKLQQTNSYCPEEKAEDVKNGTDKIYFLGGNKDPEDLHFIYKNQGKYQEAIQILKKAIEENSDNGAFYIRLGDCYVEIGQFEEAEAAYKSAIKMNPGSVWALTQLGFYYIHRGRHEEGEAVFKKVINLNSEDKNIYLGIGRCYTGGSGAYIGLGHSYTDQGRYKEAEEILKKAIEINPKDNDAYSELITCYRNQKKYKELQELSDKLIKEGLNNDVFNSFIGTIYTEQGESDEAKKFFKKADKTRLNTYNSITRHNYQKLKETVTQKGIKLLCVQYPMLNIEPLKRLFDSIEGVIFVDNEKTFQDAIRHGKYDDYFTDNFAGNFGHCTPQGNRLLAENIARAIIKEFF